MPLGQLRVISVGEHIAVVRRTLKFSVPDFRRGLVCGSTSFDGVQLRQQCIDLGHWCRCCFHRLS